ncbi:hypothetical protein ACFRCQ_06775 [Cytobacillus firmus]
MTILQDKISSLLEINRSLTQSLELEEILKRLVQAAFVDWPGAERRADYE